MNSNGYITAPISLKDDVYHVLGISPSGAYYDLAEACTSNQINRWSKHKPYITKNNSYESIPYSTIQFVKEDGTIVNVTEDPSKEGDNGAQVFWGLNAKPSSSMRSGKQLKDWLLTYFSQYTWEYQKPVVNTNWMRLTDFEYYRDNAEAPIIIEPHTEVKELIDSTGNLKVVNLFPNANFTIEFDALPGNNNGFVSTLEFFQRQPELRFAVEMWPHVSAEGSWTEAVYPNELLGKWFSRTLLYDQAPRFMMNVKDCLDYLYGVDNYWHIGENGPTVNFMLALQEANGNPNEEIFFNPNNNSVPAGDMTVVTTDPSVEGTIIPAPGYVGFYGNPGFCWPIQFGCWFNRNLTNIKWGYNISYSPWIQFKTSDLPTSQQSQNISAYSSTLYIQMKVEKKVGEGFVIKTADKSYSGNSIKFGAYCTNASGSQTPIIAEVILDPQMTNDEWNGNGTTTNVDATYTAGEGTLQLYLRFPDFWVKPSSGQGCKIRLMASMADDPNTLKEGSSSVLDNWFDINTLCVMADGNAMSGNTIDTDVYYE